MNSLLLFLDRDRDRDLHWRAVQRRKNGESGAVSPAGNILPVVRQPTIVWMSWDGVWGA